MKTVLLLRHAKSAWDNAGLTDHERPLIVQPGQREIPGRARRQRRAGSCLQNSPELPAVGQHMNPSAAHAAALAEGKGIVVVDGKLIENLHVLNARRLVDLAAAIASLESAA